MEIATRPQPSHTAVPIRIPLPWHIGVGLGVMTSVIFIISLTLALSRHDVTDPFVEYANLFGTEARQAALERGFACPYPAADYCVHSNPDSVFSNISMRMTGDSATEIRFRTQTNTLKLGDLVLLWGTPHIRTYCEMMVATWARHRIAAVTPIPQTRHLTYFEPIASISFLRNGSPQWERVLMNDVLNGCDGAR